MPNMNGIELIKEVRKVRPGIPVILATGFSNKIKMNEIKTLDILFLNKPVNEQVLLSSVFKKLNNISETDENTV